MFVKSGQAQSPARSDAQKGKVFITKVQPPVIPQFAHVGNMHGDVELILQIRKDGTVQSVNAVSGPPLLQRAAVESAQQSLFQCRGCIEDVTAYSLAYSFQLANGDCCNSPNAPLAVQASENRISVTLSHFCICDSGPFEQKIRSMKCLYLWRCAVR